MKTRWLVWMTAVVFLLGTALSAGAIPAMGTPSPPVGLLLEVRGPVTVRRVRKVLAPVLTLPLRPGDVIYTGESGEAQVVFSHDGARFALPSRSAVGRIVVFGPCMAYLALPARASRRLAISLMNVWPEATGCLHVSIPLDAVPASCPMALVTRPRHTYLMP